MKSAGKNWSGFTERGPCFPTTWFGKSSPAPTRSAAHSLRNSSAAEGKAQLLEIRHIDRTNVGLQVVNHGLWLGYCIGRRRRPSRAMSPSPRRAGGWGKPSRQQRSISCRRAGDTGMLAPILKKRFYIISQSDRSGRNRLSGDRSRCWCSRWWPSAGGRCCPARRFWYPLAWLATRLTIAEAAAACRSAAGRAHDRMGHSRTHGGSQHLRKRQQRCHSPVWQSQTGLQNVF
jgi:hypothetical protein